MVFLITVCWCFVFVKIDLGCFGDCFVLLVVLFVLLIALRLR